MGPTSETVLEFGISFESWHDTGRRTAPVSQNQRLVLRPPFLKKGVREIFSVISQNPANPFLAKEAIERLAADCSAILGGAPDY
jgi:hypothetical protein